MCISDDKCALITAILQSDELTVQILNYLDSSGEESEADMETPETEEETEIVFKRRAGKPIYGWE